MSDMQTSWNGSKGNWENLSTSSAWTTTEQFARERGIEPYISLERPNYVNGRIFTLGNLMVVRRDLHTELLNRIGCLVVCYKILAED